MSSGTAAAFFSESIIRVAITGRNLARGLESDCFRTKKRVWLTRGFRCSVENNSVNKHRNGSYTITHSPGSSLIQGCKGLNEREEKTERGDNVPHASEDQSHLEQEV